MFYKRTEQPLCFSIWLSGNGVATMLGALLGFALGHTLNTILPSWQLIFLTFGLLNLLTGTVFLYRMPDSPHSAKFLTHRQRVVAVQRVVTKNMIGVKTRMIKTGKALEVVRDVKVCVVLGLGVGL